MSDTVNVSNDSWYHVRTEDVTTLEVELTEYFDKLFEHNYFTHMSPIMEPGVTDSSLADVFDSCEDTLPEATNTVVAVSTKKQARKKANKTSAQKYRAKKKDEQKKLRQLCEALEDTNRELRILVKQSADQIQALEEHLEELKNNGIAV